MPMCRNQRWVTEVTKVLGRSLKGGASVVGMGARGEETVLAAVVARGGEWTPHVPRSGHPGNRCKSRAMATPEASGVRVLLDAGAREGGDRGLTGEMGALLIWLAMLDMIGPQGLAVGAGPSPEATGVMAALLSSKAAPSMSKAMNATALKPFIWSLEIDGVIWRIRLIKESSKVFE